MITVTGFWELERSPQLSASPAKFGRQGEYAGWQLVAVVVGASVFVVVVVDATVVVGAIVVVVGAAVSAGTGAGAMSSHLPRPAEMASKSAWEIVSDQASFTDPYCTRYAQVCAWFDGE